MSQLTVIESRYRTGTSIGGWCARDERGIIEVTGADRASWLNNLVTNVIKTLQPGEGNYAFAVNIKGRTIFDLNMLVLEDRLWLDVDRRMLPVAMSHFERYVITEDVKTSDISSRFSRTAIMGPKAHEVVSRLGLGNLVPMAQLQHVAGQVGSRPLHMIRHDFAGLPTAELLVPGEHSDELNKVTEQVCRDHGLIELDRDIVETLRIEAGIPASVDDIDEEVVPPETGQIERGISYHKGCYLGQEVIERMRSHGILARKLVGIQVGRAKSGESASAVASSADPLAAVALPSKGMSILSGEKEVGRVTSACHSVALGCPLALGYVKVAFAAPGSTLSIKAESNEYSGEVISIPVR